MISASAGDGRRQPPNARSPPRHNLGRAASYGCVATDVSPHHSLLPGRDTVRTFFRVDPGERTLAPVREHLYKSGNKAFFGRIRRSDASGGVPVSSMPTAKNHLRRVRSKRASKADLKGPVFRYIDRVYGDHVAQEAQESLEELQDLRNQIVAAGTSFARDEHQARSEVLTCGPGLLFVDAIAVCDLFQPPPARTDVLRSVPRDACFVSSLLTVYKAMWLAWQCLCGVCLLFALEHPGGWKVCLAVRTEGTSLWCNTLLGVHAAVP